MTVRRWLSLIVLATVVGRVGFVIAFNHTLSLQTSGYDTYAVHVMDGDGYTRFDDRHGDSDLPPLYPFFLMGVYSVLGRDPIAVAVAQIGLDVLVVLLLFWIGRRVAGDTVGLWAAVFYGLYPYLLYQNLTLNDTGLFILMLTAGIAAAYRARDTGSWRWAVALGISFGLGALTKTLIVLVLPPIALWWWARIGLRRAVVLSAVSGTALILVIAPWAIRNTRLQGSFVLVSTNGGSNLYQGNNPCVADTLAHGWDAQWVNCLKPVPAGLSETEADRWSREQALHYLRDNPDQWPRLLWIKLRVLWSPAIMPYDLPPDAVMQDDAVLQFTTRAFQLARVVHVLYFGPLLLLGAAGLILGWRARLEIGPLVAVLGAITVAYLIFHPSTRYRAPADPFVFVLAAISVTRLVRRVRTL